MNLNKITIHIELKDDVHTFTQSLKLTDRLKEFNEWIKYKIPEDDFNGIWEQFGAGAFYADEVPDHHHLKWVLEDWGQNDDYSWLGNVFNGDNGRPIIRSYWTEDVSIKKD